MLLGALVIGFAAHLIGRPRIRRLLPGVRLDEFAYVAAPGIVKHHRLGTWTCRDSIMLLGGRSRKPVEVQFIGRERVAILRFTSPDDPDFIALWQRWNHPHPRPELLLGEEVPSAGADSR